MNSEFNISKVKFGGAMRTASERELIKSKKIYDEFVENMDKSDFCNSERRYIAELTYVRRLIKYYTEEECPNFLFKMRKRETEILEKLKNDFGLTIRE